MLETFFNPATFDPNFVYIALVLGLWIGVTAVYIPGTWLPEVGSLLLITGSLFVLTALPTNWVAVLVMVSGVAAFVLLPFFGENYTKFAEVGLVLQALGGYFLFEGAQVSLIVIIVTVILGLLYNRLVLIPTLRNSRTYNEYDESNEVIGVRGRVVKPLDPVGTIYVNKELWRARSEEYLPADTPVIVIAQDGLELIVEKTKNEDVPYYHKNGNGASA